MTLFLSECPLWVLAILVVVLPVIASCWILVRIRHRVGLTALASNNEVAGFKFAVVGIIYAVLLGFAVIVVWGRYNEAEIVVLREAGAAATVYRLAAGDEPEQVATRAAVGNYLRLAIEKDWPQMAAETESADTTAALNDVYAAAERLAQSGSRPHAVVAEMFTQLDAITEARRSRLHLATGIVPVVLWDALIVGGLLTVGFTYFFGTKNLRAQVLMTGILAIIVFMGLFVTLAIDHPFTGPVHVDSGPLQRVLRDLAGG
jgi:hypothetical protein